MPCVRFRFLLAETGECHSCTQHPVLLKMAILYHRNSSLSTYSSNALPTSVTPPCGICMVGYEGYVPTNYFPEDFQPRAKQDQRLQVRQRSVEGVYLLWHKLKCSYCSQPISAECGTSKAGAKKRYYKCFSRKNHNRAKSL